MIVNIGLFTMFFPMILVYLGIYSSSGMKRYGSGRPGSNLFEVVV